MKSRPKPLKHRNIQAAYSGVAAFIEGAMALNLFAQAALSKEDIAPEDAAEMLAYIPVIIDDLKAQGLPTKE